MTDFILTFVKKLLCDTLEMHDYSDMYDLIVVVLLLNIWGILEGCYISGIRAGRSVRPVVVSFCLTIVYCYQSNFKLCCIDKLKWLEGMTLQWLPQCKQWHKLCRTCQMLVVMLDHVAWRLFRERIRRCLKGSMIQMQPWDG
jgi:hypothetical protein